MLVEELVAHRSFVAWHDRGCEDRFVFWKCFLGDERARQVQIAAWPSRLAAESPEILDELADLLVRQLIAEGRHELIESADGAARMDDGIPVEVGFRRRQAAVGEIGRLELESSERDRLSFTVRAVARHAGPLIQLLAAQSGTVARLGAHTRGVSADEDREERRDPRHPACRGSHGLGFGRHLNIGNPTCGNLRIGLRISV